MLSLVWDLLIEETHLTSTSHYKIILSKLFSLSNDGRKEDMTNTNFYIQLEYTEHYKAMNVIINVIIFIWLPVVNR